MRQSVIFHQFDFIINIQHVGSKFSRIHLKYFDI